MNGRPNNEDKPTWIKRGLESEIDFAGRLIGAGCSVFQNPAKCEMPYTHDFYMIVPADLKTIRTPFETAEFKYGIPARYAITLNKKDVERYAELYPHINIIFDIDLPGFKSIRFASLREILSRIKRGHAKLHTYIHRVDDLAGNAKDSWVLNATWFSELGKP